MGALLVQTGEGIRFKLGTGFTDAERDQPPAVGTWVTYRFRGLNDSGVPRFASFVRVRTDMPR
jgi:DNA ligase-1